MAPTSLDTEPGLSTPDDVRLMGAPAGRPLPAGKVILVVVIALLTAMLLNSGAVVRAGSGMPDGVTRTLTLAVARPVDRIARITGLDLPRRGLDAVFGNEALTTSGADGLLGGAAQQTVPPTPLLSPEPSRAGGQTLPPTQGSGPTTGPTVNTGAQPTPSSGPKPSVLPAVAPQAPTLRTPTAADPLRVLVTGDSLASFVGEAITNAPSVKGLLKVTTVARDGTGLTRPGFFDWALAARRDVAQRKPEVVVMILGGNDGWNLTHDGTLYGPNSDPWQQEYAKRVATVMRELVDAGVAQVYWSGPPTASSKKWNKIFARQNVAIAQAAAAVPGVTYVDLYRGTAVDGAYSDYLTIDGQRVLAREADGIHWSRAGAKQPAELILAALRADAGLS